MTIEVATRGLKELLEYFERLPHIAEEASILAVNDSAAFSQRTGSKGIRSQVNLTAGYLGSPNDGAGARLGITKRAHAGDVEAVVRGRERPTSLARFAVGTKTPGRRTAGRPVRVKVAASGAARVMPGAWLVRLRSGRNMDDDNFNLGLAVRLRPGQRLNKREMSTPIGAPSKDGSRVYLLYGPSVAQVFREVAQTLQDPVSDRVESEFIRQFERLSKR